MPNKLFKPPMTRDMLKEIDDRNLGNADVRALLWEIKRLRAIVLRADQLQKSLYGTPAGACGIILDAMRRDLEGEPVIAEIVPIGNP